MSEESAARALKSSKSGVLIGPCCTRKFKVSEGTITQVYWSSADVGAAAGCSDAKGQVHVEASIYAANNGVKDTHEEAVSEEEQIKRATQSWTKMLQNPIRKTRDGQSVDLFEKFVECLQEAGQDRGLPKDASSITEAHIALAYNNFSEFLNSGEHKLGFKRSTYAWTEEQARGFIEKKVVGRTTGDQKINAEFSRRVAEANKKLHKTITDMNSETTVMLNKMRNELNVVDRGIAVVSLVKSKRITSVEAKKELDKLANVAISKTKSSNEDRKALRDYDALIKGFEEEGYESLKKSPEIAAYIAKLKADKEMAVTNAKETDSAVRNQAAFASIIGYQALLKNQVHLKKLSDSEIKDISFKIEALRNYISDEFGTDIDPSTRIKLKGADKNKVYGTLADMLSQDPLRYKKTLVLLTEGVVSKTNQDALDRRSQEYVEGRFSAGASGAEDSWKKSTSKKKNRE
jgi:hypothetical protein